MPVRDLSEVAEEGSPGAPEAARDRTRRSGPSSRARELDVVDYK